MPTISSEKLEADIQDILRRADADNPDAFDELDGLIEPRRLPGGELLWVTRGAPTRLSDIPHNLMLGRIPFSEVKRAAKLRRYRNKLKDENYSGPKILAEGDSWFEYPTAKDLIDRLGEKYAVLSLARAGDKWFNIKQQESEFYKDKTSKGLFHNFHSEKPHIVLLSVGGNEVLGEIEKYVAYYDEHNPNKPGLDYILPNFRKTLDAVEQDYMDYVGQITPTAQVILHSYDYPDVREQSNGGQWIGGPLENERGIEFERVWREIANGMLSQLCERLDRVARAFPGRVHFVNQLGTIGKLDSAPIRSNWQDELHPSKYGSEIMCRAIAAKIDEIWKHSSV